jgi:hypothetical protein
MTPDSPTLTPQIIIDSYQRAYKQVHGHYATVVHVGGQWYRVSGELIHRVTLLQEIARLSDIAQKQTLPKSNKNMIQRLILKLRGL